MGKRGPKPAAGRDTDIVRRYMDGETLEQIGKSLGLTRERIRQILWREVGQEKAKAARQRRVATIAIAREPLPTTNCLVCGRPMAPAPNYRRITCGHECYVDYQVAGRYLDPVRLETHRLAMAKWTLEHSSNECQRRFAERVLAGTANRRPLPIRSALVASTLERIETKRATISQDWEVEFRQ